MPEHAPYIDPVTMEWVFPTGERTPVIAGGSAMVTDEIVVEDDDKDDVDESDDDDDDKDDDDDWDPPTKTEWERIQAALKGERRDRRALKRDYEDKIANLTTSGSAAAEVEIEKTRIETEQKVEKKWLKRVVRSEAAKLLVDAGASAGTADRLARLVDLDKVSYDERSDELDGLDDEVDDIVAEHGDLFKPKDTARDNAPSPRNRPRVDGASRGGRPPGGGGGSGGGGRAKRSSADIIAGSVLGRQARGQRRG